MSPLISQVEFEIPIASGDHSFKLNLGGGSFLRLNIFEKSFGAMLMCGLDDYGSGLRTLYVLVCGQISMVCGKGLLANERREIVQMSFCLSSRPTQMHSARTNSDRDQHKVF